MKFAIIFGVLALAYSCNAFGDHHPVFEAMVWKTEGVIGALRRLEKDLEGRQQTVDEYIVKVKNYKTESFKNISENLDKAEKTFKSIQCPSNFEELKAEGKELKTKLYKCVNKEADKLKELRSSMTVDDKGLKDLQGFEDRIQGCKDQVHDFFSALNGFWCLADIKREALTMTPGFTLQVMRSLPYKITLETSDKAASRCASSYKVNNFAKKLSKELESCESKSSN